MPRAPFEHDGLTPPEAARSVPVEIPQAGSRAPEPAPAAGGADDIRDTVARRHRALDPPPPEAGGGDVWDAVARLGDARRQPAEVPREAGTRTARAAA
ncbi:MAG: hypothetical protein LBC55_05130, partial [Desulfovibrio sp.]|nr:hypothetical protein [Desulfovibrio sp.]